MPIKPENRIDELERKDTIAIKVNSFKVLKGHNGEILLTKTPTLFTIIKSLNQLQVTPRSTFEIA